MEDKCFNEIIDSTASQRYKDVLTKVRDMAKRTREEKRAEEAAEATEGTQQSQMSTGQFAPQQQQFEKNGAQWVPGAEIAGPTVGFGTFAAAGAGLNRANVVPKAVGAFQQAGKVSWGLIRGSGPVLRALNQ